MFRVFKAEKGTAFLKRINEAISLIDTEALGLPRVVAAYLVTGKEKALIDMGYRSSAEIVARALNEQGIGADDLDYLLPTHVHLDHSGSCGTLAQRFPRAIVRVHPVGEPHLSDPARLVKGATELFGEALMQRYGLPDPIEGKRIRSLADDEEINLGSGITLRVIWTPGHASHHLSYLVEGTGMVFTGDAVGVYYPDFPVLVPTTPPPSFNLDLALASIDRIRGFSPSQLYTPHFGILDNAMERLGQNARALEDWNVALGKLVACGFSVDQMAANLSETVSQAGRAVGDVPEHLRILIGVDVLGFLRFLSKKSNSVSKG